MAGAVVFLIGAVIIILMGVAAVQMAPPRVSIVQVVPTKPQVQPKPKKLSWPAEQIVTLYDSLPDENKAMGDVRMIVEALDVKHGHPSVVNRHFVVSDFEKRRATHTSVTVERYQSWHHGCEGDCWMPEYTEIVDAIRTIHSELRKQKSILERKAKENARALELAGIEPAIKDIPAFMASLRNEAGTVKSITEDIL